MISTGVMPFTCRSVETRAAATPTNLIEEEALSPRSTFSLMRSAQYDSPSA
jgi:hypothetical protein